MKLLKLSAVVFVCCQEEVDTSVSVLEVIDTRVAVLEVVDTSVLVLVLPWSDEYPGRVSDPDLKQILGMPAHTERGRLRFSVHSLNIFYLQFEGFSTLGCT
ncbi:hypothetical protein KC19_10G091000 [Ceratodon purpureus]|uniref:Uncharacterized protein n=1 Tax=Ceratodon purpureus TaxID=3225 RepID=A0A8T0GID4_CERPU|nr:hypothetical protein KC19_10G091000 [Ceratodon purpureus]